MELLIFYLGMVVIMATAIGWDLEKHKDDYDRREKYVILVLGSFFWPLAIPFFIIGAAAGFGAWLRRKW